MVTPLNMHARPHVSAAIKQLRGWVTLASIVVVLCGLTQSFVFAFVQYTDMRYAEVRTVKPDRPLRVVVVGGPSVANGVAAAASVDHEVVAGVRGLNEGAKTNVSVVRTKTAWDGILARSSGLACSIGTLSVIGLCVLSRLGVVIAGGGAVPGVERVVTAGVWSMVMAFLVLPWADIMPSMGIPGVFAGYETMTANVEAHEAAGGAILGSFGALMQWVGLPLVNAVAAVGVCLWFRAGVERGVIITSVSQLDRAVEREASALAREGGVAAGPRAVGALNRAIGEMPSAVGTRAQAASLEDALDEAAAAAGELTGEATGAAEMQGRRGRSAADRAFKRLI